MYVHTWVLYSGIYKTLCLWTLYSGLYTLYYGVRLRRFWTTLHCVQLVVAELLYDSGIWNFYERCINRNTLWSENLVDFAGSCWAGCHFRVFAFSQLIFSKIVRERVFPLKFYFLEDLSFHLPQKNFEAVRVCFHEDITSFISFFRFFMIIIEYLCVFLYISGWWIHS